MAVDETVSTSELAAARPSEARTERGPELQGKLRPAIRPSEPKASTRQERLRRVRRPCSWMRQSSVISASRMTAASLPPNLVSNTVMPTKLYSGGAAFISVCMVPVRFVASRM